MSFLYYFREEIAPPPPNRSHFQRGHFRSLTFDTAIKIIPRYFLFSKYFKEK